MSRSGLGEPLGLDEFSETIIMEVASQGSADKQFSESIVNAEINEEFYVRSPVPVSLEHGESMVIPPIEIEGLKIEVLEK